MLDKFNKLFNKIIAEQNSSYDIEFSDEETSRLEYAGFKRLVGWPNHWAYMENMFDDPDDQENRINIFKDENGFGCQLNTLLQSYMQENDYVILCEGLQTLDELKEALIPQLKDYIQNKAMDDAKKASSACQDDPNSEEDINEKIDAAIPYLEKALAEIKRM